MLELSSDDLWCADAVDGDCTLQCDGLGDAELWVLAEGLRRMAGLSFHNNVLDSSEEFWGRLLGDDRKVWTKEPSTVRYRERTAVASVWVEIEPRHEKECFALPKPPCMSSAILPLTPTRVPEVSALCVNVSM